MFENQTIWITGASSGIGEALAKALGVPVAYFHATSDVLAEVILLVARLPASRQQAVLNLIKDYTEGKSPPAV